MFSYFLDLPRPDCRIILVRIIWQICSEIGMKNKKVLIRKMSFPRSDGFIR